MAINFPSSPTNGQLHTEGGITWIYVTAKAVWQISMTGTLLAHTHPQADIVNLVADLAAKAALVHTHVAADITDSTASGRALLLAANAGAQRALLDLEVGIDFLSIAATNAAIATITEDARTSIAETLVLTDAGKLVSFNNVATQTLTIPTNASVAFPINTYIDLMQLGTGSVTISPTGITLLSSLSKQKITGQYSGATLWKKATDTWVLTGDIRL